MLLFLYRQRHLITLLVMAALWLLLFPIWSYWIAKSPLDEGITLSPGGAISKEIRIINPEYYLLNLNFEQGNTPREQLHTLLGDGSLNKDGKPIPSIRVPIRWELRAVPSGSIAAAKELDSFGVTAYGADFFYRQIGGFQVKPGRYLFKAKILRDVPELAHIKTRLVMNPYPKIASTWQSTLLWWGGIATYILVWPVAVILFLVFLWQVWHAWRAGLIFRSRKP